jgi:AraC-like DNA-binding protein
MTAGAKELTARATRSANGVLGASPPQPAGSVRAFIDALKQLGFDVTALLGAAGLRYDDLTDPDALVPCASFARVIDDAIAQRQFPNLGARLGMVTPIGAFPLLDYLVVTADTVGDALRQLQRYFHITSAPMTLRIAADEESVRLIFEPGTNPFLTQYDAAIVVHHLRAETDQRFDVAGVSLMSEPEDRCDLARLLGCPVRAPETWSGVEFSPGTMRIPLKRRDAVLRRVLERQAIDPPRGADAAQGGVAAQVRGLLASRIGHEIPDLGQVASQLAMSSRTLQRRLGMEGVSYKDLVDLARRGAADALLADSSLAVAEVGYLLGFSEPSAFHRAFKRWHDMTPLDYRRAHDRGAASPQGLRGP